jgi:hypothetical protein
MMQTSFKYSTDSQQPLSLPVIEYDEEIGEVNSSSADVYGQKHPIETDELLQNSLRDFDDTLQNHVPISKKKSAMDAQRKCPSLINDSFKLMFLRCECFKVDVCCNLRPLFQCGLVYPIMAHQSLS